MVDSPGPKPAVRRMLASRTVITNAEARARGLTSDQLRSKAVTRIFHGVYAVDADPHDVRIRAKAALAVAGEGCLVCEATALRILGASLPRRFVDDTVHILARPGASGPQVEGIRVHRCESQGISLTESDVALLDPIESWIQLAARATVDELVIVADSLMRRSRPVIAREELLPIVAARTHARGIRRAREAADLSRAGTGSPAETRVRLALVRAGLPCPEVGYVGSTRVQADRIQMAYPEEMVAVEVEGGSDVQKIEQSQLRRRELEGWGWRVISVWRSDLKDSSGLVDSVRLGLGIHAAPPRHGV